MSELVKLHKINKDIIWRAGKTGEILDDAAVREANRYVALYYLEERQLERRVDREVYVPRSTIKDNEKKTITEYLELHRRESFIHLGNAERETSLTLTGNSTISTRRRDCLLGLARQRGIEVRDGFDETVPLIGSRLWWTHHLNELVKNVEDVLMTLPPSRRPETEGNVQFWGERPAQLRFGCRLGSISYPPYQVSLIDDKVKQLLTTPALQHAQLDTRAEFEQMLKAAAEHCREALTTTAEIWRAIETTIQNMLSETMNDVWISSELVHVSYHSISLRTKGLPSADLELIKLGKPRIVYRYKDAGILHDVYLASASMERLEVLEEVAAQLNNLVNSSEMHQRLANSLQEVRSSEEVMEKLLAEIRGLLETWRAKGLTGECEICRDVTPKPSSW
jgi:hypothetical protein